MRGVNKVIIDETDWDEFDMYLSGMSIPEVSDRTEIPLSTLRFRFKKAGILRSRADGVRGAADRGRLSSNKGVRREFTQEWCDNLAKAKLASGEKNSAGIDTSKGYPRFTRGKNKDVFVHKFVMETWLGRKLVDGECVHHIDGSKTNNDIDNLCLMTLSGHAKLHRLQDELEGKQRQRNENGEYI